MKVVTHDGTFHADDVFAYAVLRAAFRDVHFVRSRDPAVIDSADLVFDVGSVYDADAHCNEHHTRERPLRTCGTPYSSVGLIWRDYGRAALHSLLQLEGQAALSSKLVAIWRISSYIEPNGMKRVWRCSPGLIQNQSPSRPTRSRTRKPRPCSGR